MDTPREYPHGRIAPDDEGHLAAVMSTDLVHKRVTIEFGKSLSWVSLTAEQCVALAAELTRRAKEIG